MDFPASKLAVSSYQNKKGEKKYQIVLNAEMFERLMNADTDLLNHIKNESKK